MDIVRRLPWLRAAADRCRLRRWCADVATFHVMRRPRPGVHRLRVRMAGRVCEAYVRGRTIDPTLAQMILCDDSEYRLPFDLQPDMILDIGANIGLTTLYYATLWPDARIYCFEPLPENLDLLHRNTAALGDRVTIIPQGLGERDGVFEYTRSDDPANFGGGGFKPRPLGPGRAGTIRLPVTTLRTVCERLAIDRVDLVKLDVEGAEASVLRGAPAGLIESCPAVIGELHEHADAEVIARLSRTHDMGFTKPLGRECYPFVARRRTSAAAATPRLAKAA